MKTMKEIFNDCSAFCSTQFNASSANYSDLDLAKYSDLFYRTKTPSIVFGEEDKIIEIINLPVADALHVVADALNDEFYVNRKETTDKMYSLSRECQEGQVDLIIYIK